MKKRVFTILLIVFLLLAAAASCNSGKSNNGDDPIDPPTAGVTETETPTEVPTDDLTDIPAESPTESPTEAPTVAPTASPTETPPAEPRTLSAEELTQLWMNISGIYHYEAGAYCSIAHVDGQSLIVSFEFYSEYGELGFAIEATTVDDIVYTVTFHVEAIEEDMMWEPHEAYNFTSTLDLSDLSNGVIKVAAVAGNYVVPGGVNVLTYFAADFDAALALYDEMNPY